MKQVWGQQFRGAFGTGAEWLENGAVSTVSKVGVNKKSWPVLEGHFTTTAANSADNKSMAQLHTFLLFVFLFMGLIPSCAWNLLG
jgi:hypothetical protein